MLGLGWCSKLGGRWLVRFRAKLPVMNLLAFAIAISLSAGLPQDQFPPPIQSPSDLGLLPAEAESWPRDVQVRRGVARILELTGLALAPDGGMSVARDEETLSNIYKARVSVESWLIGLPGGFMKGLGPEGKALEKKLHKAWDVIPKLLEAKSTRFFPDIPENHMVYEALADLKRQGMLAHPGRWAKGPITRHYFAVAAREACVQAPKAAAALVTAGGELRADRSMTLAAALSGLKLLIDEFQVELRILGCDPAQMRHEVDLASRGGFKDVPATHWAAPAIEALHRKGLLKGYPGKTFVNP